jgi:hypothetical protein
MDHLGRVLHQDSIGVQRILSFPFSDHHRSSRDSVQPRQPQPSLSISSTSW